jgi:hypothetical protein
VLVISKKGRPVIDGFLSPWTLTNMVNVLAQETYVMPVPVDRRQLNLADYIP